MKRIIYTHNTQCRLGLSQRILLVDVSMCVLVHSG